MDINLNELVSDCRRGDKKAKEELIEMFRPLVLRTVYRCPMERGMREDMVQQGYLIVLESVKTYNPGGDVTFAGYLKRALYYGVYRSLSGRKTISLDESMCEDGKLLDIIPDESPEAEELVIDNEEQAALYKAVDTLTPGQKKIILEKYFKNKCLTEIVSEGKTCYLSLVRMHGRALEKLRSYPKW